MGVPLFSVYEPINGESRVHENPALKLTDAERAQGVTPSNFAFSPGNIRRYGAEVDGVTDDSAAFRKALDVAAADGSTVTCVPPGEIKLASVIYIPQRTNVLSAWNGIRISLYGCKLIGQANGTGTVLESGTGTLSTGGGTNFGESNESSTSIHTGLIIEGAQFESFGLALNLFNCVQNCTLRDLWFSSGKKALYAKRCFYMTMFNCSARITGLSASDSVFNFDSENNAITLIAVNGIAAGGVFMQFDGGVKGLMINNCTMEGSDTGLKFNGVVYGAEIRGNYIEGNTTGIDLGTIPKDGLNIDGNYFTLNTTDLTGDNWQSGTFGAGNNVEDGPTIDLSGSGNFCRVELPTRFFTELNHTGWTRVPSGWSVSSAAQLVHHDFIYSNSIGPTQLYARLVPSEGGGITPLNYTGAGGALVTNLIPFCTTSLQNSNNDLRIDTKITYGAGAGALFDVLVNDSVGQYNFGGRVTLTNVIYRDDGSPQTITVANNGGLLRLTIAGFSGITSYTGTVRIV